MSDSPAVNQSFFGYHDVSAVTMVLLLVHTRAPLLGTTARFLCPSTIITNGRPFRGILCRCRLVR